MSAAGVLAGQGHVRIGLDDKALYTGLKAMQVRLRSLGQQMASTGATMFGVGAAGLAPLIPAIMKASDAAEGYNRFLAVMGQEAKATDAALAEMGKRIGRNQVELRDTASSFQGMFVGLGMTKAEAAKLATQMTELSLDFASFNNLADSDASERFLAGLSGSSEVFDRFGINIKEAALKAKLAEMGIKGTATELQKTQARIAIITESMARQGATKDATTTAGSFANQLKAIKAEATSAAQEIGASLIPVLQKYLPQVREILTSGAKWLKQNPEIIVQYAKLAAGVAAAGAALFTAGKAAEAVTSAIDISSGAVTSLKTNWQAFLAIGVAAAIAKIAYEIYQANSAVKDFNASMLRASQLAGQLQEKTVGDLGSMEKSIQTARDLREAERIVRDIENRAAGARSSMEGARARHNRLSEGWRGYVPGQMVLAESASELAEAEKRFDAYSQSAQRARSALDKLRKSRELELETIRKAEQAKRSEIEKTRQTELAAEQQRLAKLAASRERAQDEFGVNPARGMRNPLWVGRQQLQQFTRMQSSLMTVMSATAAKGLAAKTVEVKTTEDLLGTIATNTRDTAEAIKNMPGLKLG